MADLFTPFSQCTLFAYVSRLDVKFPGTACRVMDEESVDVKKVNEGHQLSRNDIRILDRIKIALGDFRAHRNERLIHHNPAQKAR